MNCYMYLIFSSYLIPKFILDEREQNIPAGILSKFGAGLFLLVQVIILLDFTHTWNDAWVEKDEQKWSAQIPISLNFPFDCF